MQTCDIQIILSIQRIFLQKDAGLLINSPNLKYNTFQVRKPNNGVRRIIDYSLYAGQDLYLFLAVSSSTAMPLF